MMRTTHHDDVNVVGQFHGGVLDRAILPFEALSGFFQTESLVQPRDRLSDVPVQQIGQDSLQGFFFGFTCSSAR
jgi:hypothetical protein